MMRPTVSICLGIVWKIGHAYCSLAGVSMLLSFVFCPVLRKSSFSGSCCWVHACIVKPCESCIEKYFSSIAILLISQSAITFLDISDCVCFVVYSHSAVLSGPLLQPDLDDGEDDVINQDIVQLKNGLHKQVRLHPCINLVFLNHIILLFPSINLRELNLISLSTCFVYLSHDTACFFLIISCVH